MYNPLDLFVSFLHNFVLELKVLEQKVSKMSQIYYSCSSTNQRRKSDVTRLARLSSRFLPMDLEERHTPTNHTVWKTWLVCH